MRQPPQATPQVLSGSTGVSDRWGSGWLDLNQPTDFEPGDIIRLKIGGTANTVVVRLLSEEQFSGDPSGIVSNPLTVPSNRVLEVKLSESRHRITQISVHGGSQPWSYALGDQNGFATLESVELLSISL